jgi:short-chain fatty acids transporter
MLRSAGQFLAEKLRQIIPDSFVFAIVLTLVVGLCAWTMTESSGKEVLDAWYRGFWILLEFGMQMVLILATGYAIALSGPVSRLIGGITGRFNRPAQVYFMVMVLGGVLGLVSWSWSIITAVFAREMAKRVEGIDYAYLTACVYLSGWTWVCGLSSSIPLVLNTEGNFMIEMGLLDSKIPISATLGSTVNIVYFLSGFIVIPFLMVLLRPRGKEATALEEMLDENSKVSTLTVAEEAEQTKFPHKTLSDSLNHGWLPQLLITLAGLTYIVSHFIKRGFDINLEIMIFIFLIAGLLFHRTPMNYVMAMKRACSNVSGIIFQYPFYAGIMGLMMFTGLGSMISSWMAGFATTTTLPVMAQFAGGFINFFIPSAGGEWAVVGPPFVEAAKSIGAALPPDELQSFISKIAMAVAYGETSTNSLQPFFLLIILPVMGAGVKIQARDVMGYLVIPFTLFYIATAAILTWVPM